MTYLKSPGADGEESEFHSFTVILPSGQAAEMELAERGVWFGNARRRIWSNLLWLTRKTHRPWHLEFQLARRRSRARSGSDLAPQRSWISRYSTTMGSKHILW